MKKKVSAVLLCALLALTPLLGACGKIRTAKNVDLSSIAYGIDNLTSEQPRAATGFIEAKEVTSFEYSVHGNYDLYTYLYPDQTNDAPGLYNASKRLNLFDPSMSSEPTYTASFEVIAEGRIIVRTVNTGDGPRSYGVIPSGGSINSFYSVPSYTYEPTERHFINGDIVIGTIDVEHETGSHATIYVAYNPISDETTTYEADQYSSAASGELGYANLSPFKSAPETELFDDYANDSSLGEYVISETPAANGSVTVKFRRQLAEKVTTLELPPYYGSVGYIAGKVIYTVFNPVAADAKSGYNVLYDGSGDTPHESAQKYNAETYSFDIEKGKTKKLSLGYIPLYFEARLGGSMIDVIALPKSGKVSYYGSEADLRYFILDSDLRVGFDATALGFDPQYVYSLYDGTFLTRTTGRQYFIADAKGNRVATLGSNVTPVYVGNTIYLIAESGRTYSVVNRKGEIVGTGYSAVVPVDDGLILIENGNDEPLLMSESGAVSAVDNTYLGLGDEDTIVTASPLRNYVNGYVVTADPTGHKQVRLIGGDPHDLLDEASYSEFTVGGHVVGLRAYVNGGYQYLLFN